MYKFSDHKVCINKNEEVHIGRGNNKTRNSMLILLEHLRNKYPEDKDTIECFMKLVREM